MDSQDVFVLKFGGTSVASARRWRRIARVVERAVANGRHPVLVCSAVAGITNALETVVAGGAPAAVLSQIWERHADLARALGLCASDVIGAEFRALSDLVVGSGARGAGSPPWSARVMAAGELMSTLLGAAWLRRAGLRVQWLDARTLLEAQPKPGAEAYLSACCGHEPCPDARRRLLQSHAQVTITQGFIARNSDGETVLLGRGGSDTSAAYIASLLGASRLEIWTDVPGLFTVDPRKAPDARLLPRLTYDEAAVMGALGAKVLHPRCLPPVQARGIPLELRWTDHPEVQGTVIGRGPAFTSTGIKAISARSNLCLLRMRRDRRWQPVGFMSDVSACFENHGLSMDLISSSPAEIRVTVDLAANPGAGERLPALLEELRALCLPSLEPSVACVSIVGTKISGEMPRIAAVMRLLEEPALHLVSHAADDTHVSYVVDERVAESLVAAIHATLFGVDAPPNTIGPSWRELQARVTGRSASAQSAGSSAEARA